MKKESAFFGVKPTFDYENCTVDEIKEKMNKLDDLQQADLISLAYRHIMLKNSSREVVQYCFYELGKHYLNVTYDYYKAYYYLNELAEMQTNMLDLYADSDLYEMLSECKSRLSGKMPPA